MSDLAAVSTEVRPAAADEPDSAGIPRTPILVMTCLAVMIGWLPRLRWGFWTDESATYWMSSEGWRIAIERTWNWPGQSILYSILESFFVVHGAWQETVLRIPSLLAVAIAAWQVKRLAELLISKEAGWYALVPFVCAPDVTSFATNARSYGLALTASLISFRYLLEWQREGGKKNAALYLLSSILTVHFHYLFGFILLIQAGYLVLRAWCGDRIRWSLPLATAAAVPLSLLLILGSLRATARQNVDFQAAPPEIRQWFQLVFPPLLLLGIALGAALVLLMVPMRKLKWSPIRLSRPVALLLTAWLLSAPTLFFLVSRLTARTMFTSRYLLFTVPAIALIVAWAVASIGNLQARTICMLAIFAASVLHPAVLLSAFRESPISWREPLHLLAGTPSNAPVFAASGFAHAVFGNWKAEDPKNSPLFAPLVAYPIANPVIPLPYQFFPDVERFIEQEMAKRSDEPVVFLLSESNSGLWPWMTKYMEGRGYRAQAEHVNDFVVVEFSRR